MFVRKQVDFIFIYKNKGVIILALNKMSRFETKRLLSKQDRVYLISRVVGGLE